MGHAFDSSHTTSYVGNTVVFLGDAETDVSWTDCDFHYWTERQLWSLTGQGVLTLSWLAFSYPSDRAALRRLEGTWPQWGVNAELYGKRRQRMAGSSFCGDKGTRICFRFDGLLSLLWFCISHTLSWGKYLIHTYARAHTYTTGVPGVRGFVIN